MRPSQRKAVLELVQLGDIGLLFCCLGVAYALTAHLRAFDLLDALETRHPIQVFIATLVLAAGWHGALRANGFYSSHRLASIRNEAWDLCSGIALCAVAGFIWLWLVSSSPKYAFSGLCEITILFGALGVAAFMTTRLMGRAAMQALRLRGYNLRQILIMGTNRRATGFARDIGLHPEWGYHLLGFIDDQWWDEQSADSKRGLLGGFDSVPDVLRALPVDEVMVALPIATFYQQVAEIVTLCRDHGIAVRSIGPFFDHEQSRRTASLPGSFGSITLHDESWGARASLIKRVVDVIVSFSLLFALAPILLSIAVLIKLTSPGPIFFVQTRMGNGKRPFQIFKFRTMVQNAETLMSQLEHLNETQGPTFKLRDDPRVTPIGRFLRKTSLDELPQLINVLIGDMSLVGPRPLPLRDYQGFSQDWHRKRFSVKPGITCLWQIMGRSTIGFDEWMALDIRYIDQWSVWLDIKILFRTIPAVIRGSGAV